MVIQKRGIGKVQEKNLHALIKHAYETVPYYNRIFKESKISPDDIKNVEDLTKIPVLTKRDISRIKMN